MNWRTRSLSNDGLITKACSMATQNSNRSLRKSHRRSMTKNIWIQLTKHFFKWTRSTNLKFFSSNQSTDVPCRFFFLLIYWYIVRKGTNWFRVLKETEWRWHTPFYFLIDAQFSSLLNFLKLLININLNFLFLMIVNVFITSNKTVKTNKAIAQYIILFLQFNFKLQSFSKKRSVCSAFVQWLKVEQTIDSLFWILSHTCFSAII